MSLKIKMGAALSWVLLAATITSCNQSPQSKAPAKRPPSQASLEWLKVAEGFEQSYFAAQPSFAALAGKHEYDGQLPDLSAHGLRREIARLHDERDQLTAVDPMLIEPGERFDRAYLLSVVDRDLYWLEKAHYPSTNPYWYLASIDPDMYVSRNYAPLNVRLKAFIKFARGIPKMVTDIQANLQGPLPKSYIEQGIAQFGGFVDFYKKDAPQVFASVSDTAMQKDLAEATTNAANAMANLTNYLTGLQKTATDKFPLGKELYAQMLKDTEQVDLPVEQIEAAGRADLERNTAALKAECATYLPKGTPAACVAKVSAKKPPEGDLEAARKQLTMLRDFVQKNNVVTIPNNDDVLVAEAPPYNRENFAFIQVPGPYDKGVAATYNIAPPNPKWTKAEQAAYIASDATLMSTSVHEVWPGHFLQFLHSNANPNKLEGLWIGYAFAEGWAHYAEEMMYEEGLNKGDSEMHIGQLMDALLRDVRLLSSIGLHTEGWTVAQCEKMFREQAFQDAGNARQQAARGTYDPAYLNYTLGKLMIRKLRTDWVAKTRAGGGAAPTTAGSTGAAPADDHALWHDFHDKFLSYGGPPIPLLRKEMVGAEGTLL
ncbi:MAG: DUF885 domain-containing protein [Steroidobacteraceae bacterium]|jgi:uncharacterized protein DUF885